MTARMAFACAALVAAAAGAAGGENDPFALGVLRRDGVLIPFATFDGRRWRDAWPVPQPTLSVPINLSSIPRGWWGPTGPLEHWQGLVGGVAQGLQVTQPDWVKVHCARHLALRTDYRADAVIPPDAEQPYPKDGLAVSPPRPIEPITTLLPTATELNDLTTVLLDAFNHSERDVASRIRHPVRRELREAVTPTIEAAYAVGTSPRYYYVEATRPYRALGRGPDDCTALAFGTGWFVRDGGASRSLLTAVDLLQCNGYGASYMLPLGVVRAADRLFWTAQFSGWEHERYAVLELAPKKVDVRISTWGGGC